MSRSRLLNVCVLLFLTSSLQPPTCDLQIITEAESPEPGSPTARKECEVKDLTLNQFQGLVEKETGSADAWQTQVVRHFRSKRKGPIAGDKPWVCDQDDKLPTLRDVFKVGRAADGLRDAAAAWSCSLRYSVPLQTAL